MDKKTKIKVSFDFDDTLDKEEVQQFAIELIDIGIDVWICTNRFPESEMIPRWNDDIYEIVDSIGISRSNIIFAQMSDKFVYLEDSNIIWHLDNSKPEIKAINKNSDVIGIHLYDPKWKSKCLKLLKKRSK